MYEYDRRSKVATGTLDPNDVGRLPVGSVVWAEEGGGSGSAWIVNEGGVILPITALPERKDGMFPDDGENPSRVTEAFRLIQKGRGKLVTHGVAQRVAINWLRDLARENRR